MGAVEAEPPRAVIAALAAVGIVFSEGQAAVHGGAGLDRVVVAAVPGVAGGGGDGPATVGDAPLPGFPLQALLEDAGGEGFLWASRGQGTPGGPSFALGGSCAPRPLSR